MTFENQVYDKLEKMKPGDRIEVDSSHPNHERFIRVVKEYIVMHDYGNGIEFSHDYKFIKKHDYSDLINNKKRKNNVQK